jgi:hypothetical protein
MTSLLRACCVGVLSSVLAAGAIARTAVAQELPAPPPDAADDQDTPQPPAEPPPGYLVSVDGAGVLERSNTSGDAIAGMPLLVGDRLRSEGGQLEIKWAERSTLQLARYTELDVLSTHMLRLPRGKLTLLLVTAPGQSAHDQLSIDAPGASVRFYGPGEYRIAVSGTDQPEVELAVVRGSAQLASDQGQVMLADGEQSTVRDGSAPTPANAYNAAPEPTAGSSYDPSSDIAAFQRNPGGAYQGTSYLPNELYGYETVFNSYGSWGADPYYGNVW